MEWCWIIGQRRGGNRGWLEPNRPPEYPRRPRTRGHDRRRVVGDKTAVPQPIKGEVGNLGIVRP
jgi:hypothetical protein